jgi:hypothetical protein
VTNRFENKTQDRLSEISENLIAAEPTIDGVAGALTAATEQITDYPRRAAGSAVRWSRSWETSLDDALMVRVIALLRG